MAEYIEREALLEDIEACVRITSRHDHPSAELRGANKVISRIEAAPAADVVPVVRCEKCRHWHRCLSDDGSVEYFNFSHCEKGHNGFSTFFCADGARMDKDGDIE